MKNDPIIGKNVIESLTTGMYEDSRFIFREYIQNSADQIDKAVKNGLIDKSEEEIHITINGENNFIEIYDNATGIVKNEVLPILQNIAQSTKEKGVDKGFRGIGRLGGLGYCDKLIFETSAYGEPEKSIMIWDAKLLKNIINNEQNKDSASDVIKKVTKLELFPEDSNKHYFRVRLEGVSNSDLLDVNKVHSYLSMVSPIDYPNVFYYRSKIYDQSKNIDTSIDSYKIFLNGDMLHKSYTISIYEEFNGGKKKCDEIIDLVFFDRYADDGQLLYWGWYSLSNLSGQMKSINNARGIRLRKSNIQIGAADVLGRFFPKQESRWSLYFFGEVHAVHPDLVPNARRDYFSENAICSEFEMKLRDDLYKPYKLCYDTSNLRSKNKDIETVNKLADTISQKEKDGFKSSQEKKELYKQFEQKKAKAEKSQKDIASLKNKLEEEQSPVQQIFDKVVTTVGVDISNLNVSQANSKTTYITDKDKYSFIPKKDRKLIGKIYEIIGNALPREIAENLIIKIEEELTK